MWFWHQKERGNIDERLDNYVTTAHSQLITHLDTRSRFLARSNVVAELFIDLNTRVDEKKESTWHADNVGRLSGGKQPNWVTSTE